MIVATARHFNLTWLTKADDLDGVRPLSSARGPGRVARSKAKIRKRKHDQQDLPGLDTEPMTAKKTALERAFEIAHTAGPDSIEDIRRQLVREGFDHRQIEGPVLIRQLRDASLKARESKGRS